MSLVFGLDLHRQQITFNGLDVESGEVWKGRVWQPDRERFRRWLERDVADPANGQPVALAVGGVHRSALRGRGDHRGGLRGVSDRPSNTSPGCGILPSWPPGRRPWRST